MENKGFLYRFFGHLSTITKHKMEVTRLCFKCGLYKQGILHDLSKYSPIEFWSGVKYYQGFRSPIDAEKEAVGYSLGWLHHKGRNKHHWEYWVDKDYVNFQHIVRKMPLNYVIEACCDKIAASKVYKKDKYYDGSAYDFLSNGKDRKFMGGENVNRHLQLLLYLKENGEEKALKYYKSLYKKWLRDKTFDI